MRERVFLFDSTRRQSCLIADLIMNEHEQNIITDVIQLWQLSTPLTEIAKRLKLPDFAVKHVIQFGTLPKVQTFFEQPSPDKTSDR